VSPRLLPPRRLALLVTTALLIAVGRPGAAPAQTVADKRAEAARIRQAVDAQAERIAAADRALRLARSDQQDADAEVLAAEAALGAARTELAEARRRLAGRAVDAYVHGGEVSVMEHIAGSDGTDLNLRRHYIDTAVRVDRDAVDAWQRTEERLAASERRLRAARQAALASVEQVAADRDAVAENEAAQRSNLRRIEGEIGALVREEQRRAYARVLASAPSARTPRAPQAPLVLGAPGTTTTTPPVDPLPPAPPHEPLGGIWACIREKESGNNYRAPGGGAYQFQLSTWQSLGGTGLPEDAPPAVQDAMAVMLQQRSGWDQWTTAKACGAY
jgi:hypothetical protein